MMRFMELGGVPGRACRNHEKRDKPLFFSAKMALVAIGARPGAYFIFVTAAVCCNESINIKTIPVVHPPSERWQAG